MKRQHRHSDQSKLEFDLPLRRAEPLTEAGEELPREPIDKVHSAASGPLISPSRSKPGPDDRHLVPLPATSQNFKAIVEPPTTEWRPSSSKKAEGEDQAEKPATRRDVRRANVGARLVAGLADLVILGTIYALMAWVLLQAGISTSPLQLGPLALFHVTFSFLYTVISLAFWGHTPGMSAMGLSAQTPGGETLTFPQAGLRWLGAALTLGLLGTPLLLALFGRSFSDRISGSVTLRRR